MNVDLLDSDDKPWSGYLCRLNYRKVGARLKRLLTGAPHFLVYNSIGHEYPIVYYGLTTNGVFAASYDATSSILVETKGMFTTHRFDSLAHGESDVPELDGTPHFNFVDTRVRITFSNDPMNKMWYFGREVFIDNRMLPLLSALADRYYGTDHRVDFMSLDEQAIMADLLLPCVENDQPYSRPKEARSVNRRVFKLDAV